MGERGLFCALCADRGSHHFHAPAAGAEVSRAAPTQVGRRWLRKQADPASDAP